MPIDVDAGGHEFHLRNEQLSYVFRILENGALGHLYFGPSLAPGRSYGHLLSAPFHGFDNRIGDPVAFEYPTTGTGDYRIPALVVEQPDGSTVVELVAAGHRLSRGKPAIPGLPSTYVESDEEAETLEIDLADKVSGLMVTLIYTIFRDLPSSRAGRGFGTAATGQSACAP